MSELKDIVPSLEQCKPIPENDFEETVMVWAEWRPVYGELRPVVAIRSEVSSRANVDIIAPAPTPIEILAVLPPGTIIMQDEPGVWVCISPMGIIVRKADSAANAALKVWLKINNIEVKL